jgi:hypothetical protein
MKSGVFQRGVRYGNETARFARLGANCQTGLATLA